MALISNLNGFEVSTRNNLPGIIFYKGNNTSIKVNTVENSFVLDSQNIRFVEYRRLTKFDDLSGADQEGQADAQSLVEFWITDNRFEPQTIPTTGGGGGTQDVNIVSQSADIATETTQTANNTLLSSILTAINAILPGIPAFALESTLQAISTKIDSVISGFTGKSTEAKQDDAIAELETIKESILAEFNPFLKTPFSRSAVSINETLFDGKKVINEQPLFYDSVINGTASVTYLSGQSAVNLFVGGTAGNYAIYQTKQRWPYQAGKGQVIKLTQRSFQPITDVIKRRGYYSSSESAPYDTDLDGIYLEASNGTVKAVVANQGTLQTAEQASWNIDTMDGTGPSGININWTNRQIAIFNFQWLGVGAVLLAFDIDRQIVPAHVFYHANNTNGGFGVYMLRPNQPIRTEVRSTGGSASVISICDAVESENGQQKTGSPFSTTPQQCYDLQCNASNTGYVLMAFRLRPGFYTAFDLMQFSAYNENADDFTLSIVINPELATGSYSFSDFGESMEISTSPPGTTPPTIINGSGRFLKSVSSKAENNGLLPDSSDFKIGTDVDGLKEIAAVIYTASQNGSDVYGSANTMENT